MSVLLAFDTSTEQMAVALHDGTREWLALGPGGALASAALLPQVRALFADAGLQVSAIDAIAFGRGPGAFTGLRTSCAVAQGLALGLERPLLPLDSLLIVAEDARFQVQQALAARDSGAEFEVGVVMDARMDEIYAGRYRWAAARWQVLQAPVLVSPAALAQQWAAPLPCLAGSAIGVFGKRLALKVHGQQIALEHDRAAALLRLARAAFAAGHGIDPALALPLYLRDKVALTTAEREAAR